MTFIQVTLEELAALVKNSGTGNVGFNDWSNSFTFSSISSLFSSSDSFNRLSSGFFNYGATSSATGAASSAGSNFLGGNSFTFNRQFLQQQEQLSLLSESTNHRDGSSWQEQFQLELLQRQLQQPLQ